MCSSRCWHWRSRPIRRASRPSCVAKEVSIRTANVVGVSDAFHLLSHHQNDPQKLARLYRRSVTYHMTRFPKYEQQ